MAISRELADRASDLFSNMDLSSIGIHMETRPPRERDPESGWQDPLYFCFDRKTDLWTHDQHLYRYGDHTDDRFNVAALIMFPDMRANRGLKSSYWRVPSIRIRIDPMFDEDNLLNYGCYRISLEPSSRSLRLRWCLEYMIGFGRIHRRDSGSMDVTDSLRTASQDELNEIISSRVMAGQQYLVDLYDEVRSKIETH